MDDPQPHDLEVDTKTIRAKHRGVVPCFFGAILYVKAFDQPYVFMRKVDASVDCQDIFAEQEATRRPLVVKAKVGMGMTLNLDVIPMTLVEVGTPVQRIAAVLTMMNTEFKSFGGSPTSKAKAYKTLLRYPPVMYALWAFVKTKPTAGDYLCVSHAVQDAHADDKDLTVLAVGQAGQVHWDAGPLILFKTDVQAGALEQMVDDFTDNEYAGYSEGSNALKTPVKSKKDEGFLL